MQFTDFNFSDEVLKGIRKAGYSECMPVQEEVYRLAMEESKDVTVQSQTGSGKTAAFLLSIFEKFVREPDAGHRALIVAPTRELAVQIEQEAQILGGHLPLSVGCFHGGVSYGPQEKKLRDGVDVIIGTPGRLLDFASSKKLIMKDIDTMVIDEADRLFDMGFYPDIRRMLKMMKSPAERQTMLFSATISQRVGHLSWEFMNGPEPIVINPEQITVDEITQEVYHVSSGEKINLLLGLLRKEAPENAIVFTNTKDMAVKLSKRLSINSYNAKYIMGDLPQNKRQAIIREIKEGDLQILVATDVAARGLHINDLDIVINYDIPEDPESYVHRIGRTARAGKSGKAVTLACEKYVYGLEAIEKFIDMKIPVQWADEELYQSEDKSAGVRVAGNRERDGGNRGGGSRGGRSGGDRRDGPRQGGRSRDKGPSRGSSRTADKPAHKPAEKKPAEEARKEKPAETKRSGESGSPARNSASGGKSVNSGKQEGGGKRQHDKAPRKAQPASTEGSPGKNDDLESRLAYYRKKYGEDFQLTDSSASSTSPRNGKKTASDEKTTASKDKRSKHDGNGNSQSRSGTSAGVSGNSNSNDAAKKSGRNKGILGKIFGK